MAEILLRTKLPRAEVLRRLRSLPRAVTRRGGKARTSADALLVRLGLAAQKFVHDAFLAKSEGRADASGLRWPELSPYTVYNKRRRIAGYRGKKPVKAVRPTDILVELTDLRESLKPAAPPAAAQPSPPKVRLQVFRLGAGVVTIGTRRRFALRHHRGDPARRLPRRRLWPEPADWPASWRQALAAASARGMIDVAFELLEGSR